MRTVLLTALVFAAFPALAWGQNSTHPPSKMTQHKAPTPDEVHRSAIVIDTHADTPQRMIDEHYDLGDPLNGGDLNLETARKGNLGAEFFSIWVDPARFKGAVRAPHTGAD